MMCYAGGLMSWVVSRKQARKWAPATGVLRPEHLKTLCTFGAADQTGAGVWRSTALWCMTAEQRFLLTARRCCLQRGQHFTHFALHAPRLSISARRPETHHQQTDGPAACLHSLIPVCVFLCVHLLHLLCAHIVVCAFVSVAGGNLLHWRKH